MLEVGSEFPWTDLPGPPHLSWPTSGRWYALGRHALGSLWHHVARPTSRLFLPSFFCPGVVQSLRQLRIPVTIYRDEPTNNEPDGSTLSARVGDVVMALNYCGIRDGSFWKKWRNEYRDVTLVEDHTHDPFSRWAVESTADYAFASLRKTFAAPDGAILWSPIRRSLPLQPPGGDWRGSALKLAGMAGKRDFLESNRRDAASRAAFRKCETEGEALLEREGGPGISPWSRALLCQGFPQVWRDARSENVRQFIAEFRRKLASTSCVELLFTAWPHGHCPFNPVLVFASEQERELVRRHLINNGVFAPVHWSVAEDCDGAAAALSRRLLTVPLDHRCPVTFIPLIVELIGESLGSTSLPASRRGGVGSWQLSVESRQRLPSPATPDLKCPRSRIW